MSVLRLRDAICDPATDAAKLSKNSRSQVEPRVQVCAICSSSAIAARASRWMERYLLPPFPANAYSNQKCERRSRLQLFEPRLSAAFAKTASEAPPDRARSHRSATLAVRVGRNRQDRKTGFARPPGIAQRRARHGIWQGATLDPAPRPERQGGTACPQSLCRIPLSAWFILRADRIRFRRATRHPARSRRSSIEIAGNIQDAPARFYSRGAVCTTRCDGTRL